jgi:hypothetical protein
MRLHVGRIRKKLSAMLAEQGLLIDPGLIDSQEGPLHRNPGNDLARWFCLAMWREDLVPERGHLCCHLYSWDRMTDCVRYGFVIRPDSQEGWYMAEVSHKGR